MDASEYEILHDQIKNRIYLGVINIPLQYP